MTKWSPKYKAQKYQIYNILLYPAIIVLLVPMLFLIKPLPLEALHIILVLGIFSFVSELFIVSLPMSGFTSVGFSISFATLIIFGPLAAMIVELFGSVTLRDIKEKTPWYVVTFNTAQLAFSIGVTGLIYKYTGGVILYESGSGAAQSLIATNYIKTFIPIFLSIVTYFLISTSIIASAIAFDEERPFLNVWLFNFKWTIPNYFALGIIGVLLAQFYHLSAQAGVLVILIFLPMLLAARAVFLGHMKLREFKDSSVKVFAKAVEVKDEYTGGHSERVAEYAAKIARDKDFAKEFKMREHQIEALRYAGYLHDIGKIGIPKRILTKPTRLNADEYEKIKEHPEVGALILKHIAVLKDVVPGVLYHHEKVDGKGYTRGLLGASIPLIARILAVADSFDAMTSKRPYRPSFSRQEAINKLFKGAGSDYDQRVVETLARVLEINHSGAEEAQKKAATK